MENKYSLAIKTTMRHHLTLVRRAITEKSTNNKCWKGCGEKGTLVHCWWDCKQVQPLWKIIQNFHKKLKIELPYDPAIPLLCIYLKKIKTQIQKDTAPLYLQKHYLQQPRYGSNLTVNQQMNRQRTREMCIYMYMYMEYYIYTWNITQP